MSMIIVIRNKKDGAFLNIYSSTAHNKAILNNKNKIIKYLTFINTKISSDPDIKQIIKTDNTLNSLFVTLFNEYREIIDSLETSSSIEPDETMNIK